MLALAVTNAGRDLETDSEADLEADLEAGLEADSEAVTQLLAEAAVASEMVKTAGRGCWLDLA